MRRGQGVKLQGVDELQATLEKMLRSTEDLRPFWTDIYYPAVLEGESNFFDTEGDGKWPDLTGRYEMLKARRGFGTRLLIGPGNADLSRHPGLRGGRRQYHRTLGELRASLTEKGHPMSILDMSARWFRHGSRDPLANIFFTKKGRRKRKPMDAKSFSMQTAFQAAVEEHARRYGAMWGGDA